MQVRLVFLLLVLVGMGIGVAIKFTGAKKTGANDGGVEEVGTTFDAGGQTLEQIREKQKPLGMRKLPGEEPVEPPQLDVRVYPDRSSGKNRLVFEVTEKHGYYVESFNVLMWYKKTPDMEPEDSPLRLQKVVEKYLKSNETLVDCMEVVPIEMSKIDGDLGGEDNWGALIEHHGRARAKNPDPLPLLDEMYHCGG